VDPLLGSDRKQVLTATSPSATIEKLLEAVFSVVRAAAIATQLRSKHLCSNESISVVFLEYIPVLFVVLTAII
jgi:hypothetical protein